MVRSGKKPPALVTLLTAWAGISHRAVVNERTSLGTYNRGSEGEQLPIWIVFGDFAEGAESAHAQPENALSAATPRDQIDKRKRLCPTEREKQNERPFQSCCLFFL
jgi:hypothetical protein